MLGKERHLCEERVFSGETSETWGPALLEQSILARRKVEGLEWQQAAYPVVSKSCADWGGFGGCYFILFPWTPPTEARMITPCTQSWAEDSRVRS